MTLVTRRRVRENANRGTDHGKWPNLDSSHLCENRDLAVTANFRDVFAELLAKGMGIALKPIFPATPG